MATPPAILEPITASTNTAIGEGLASCKGWIPSMIMLAHDLDDLAENPRESLSGCSGLAATIIGVAEPTGGPPVARRRR